MTGQPEKVADSMARTSANRSRLLTAGELAERWRVPKAHVYRLARSGRLPVVRLGKYRRFRVAAVEEFETSGGAGADE